MKWTACLAAAALAFAGCGDGGNGDGNSGGSGSKDGTAAGKIREPAVAGMWYASDPNVLAGQVDRALRSASAVVEGKVRAVICPHAGYEFSGATAAVAYKQLMGADVRTVFVLSQSHTATFQGASIPPVEFYRTPLGLVPLSPKAAEMARTPPFTSSPQAQVRRPRKWQEWPKQAPPEGQDTPHTWEHTIEAQLPFLQRALTGFDLVPILYGDVDPKEVATALSKELDDRTVLVVSSDLSHYYPEAAAVAFDAWVLKAVREMDLEAMAQQKACGKLPILTVMQLAKERGWKSKVLHYTHSGQSPRGDKKSVVGYMAAVFYEEAAAKAAPLTDEQRKFLLTLARRSVTAAAKAAGEATPEMLKQRKFSVTVPQVDRTKLPSELRVPRGCFVTLEKKGDDGKLELRGCIGDIMPKSPLYEAVMTKAVEAALRDARYPPVKPDELDQIELDISVLTVPKPLYYDKQSDLLTLLRPGVDGVVLQVPVVVSGRRAMANSVFLPMVWKKIPDPEEFMRQLTLKALVSLKMQLRAATGRPVNVPMSPDAWRQPGARVLTFQAEEFREPKE